MRVTRSVIGGQNQMTTDRNFLKKNLFSGEPPSWLNGYVNTRNWSDVHPQAIDEAPLHPQKVSVWWALGAEGIIGSYFYSQRVTL